MVGLAPGATWFWSRFSEASGNRTERPVQRTSNLRLASAPGNVSLENRESGLPKDSVINISQILTVDKSFLTEQVSTLPDQVMIRLSAGLRLVLGL